MVEADQPPPEGRSGWTVCRKSYTKERIENIAGVTNLCTDIFKQYYSAVARRCSVYQGLNVTVALVRHFGKRFSGLIDLGYGSKILKILSLSPVPSNFVAIVSNTSSRTDHFLSSIFPMSRWLMSWLVSKVIFRARFELTATKTVLKLWSGHRFILKIITTSSSPSDGHKLIPGKCPWEGPPEAQRQ